MKPFLKWAGGKTQALDDIESVFPFSKQDKFTFIEPFVGGGAMLFWVLRNHPNVQKCVINDINEDLIITYKIVRDLVKGLISTLTLWQEEYHALESNKEEKKVYYYNKRTSFNSKTESDLIQAALFIFLNRTCFNGLYRVNKRGGFNVPIGGYKKPLICDPDNLTKVSEALQRVAILKGDFEDTLEHTEDDTIFYLDPPYKPLSKSSSFNAYAKSEFDNSEQIRLKSFCDRLSGKGHAWILSNSDVRQQKNCNLFFDDLYSSYNIKRIRARRTINSNSEKRGEINELLITNVHEKAVKND